MMTDKEKIDYFRIELKREWKSSKNDCITEMILGWFYTQYINVFGKGEEDE